MRYVFNTLKQSNSKALLSMYGTSFLYPETKAHPVRLIKSVMFLSVVLSVEQLPKCTILPFNLPSNTSAISFSVIYSFPNKCGSCVRDTLYIQRCSLSTVFV